MITSTQPATNGNGTEEQREHALAKSALNYETGTEQAVEAVTHLLLQNPEAGAVVAGAVILFGNPEARMEILTGLVQNSRVTFDSKHALAVSMMEDTRGILTEGGNYILGQIGAFEGQELSATAASTKALITALGALIATDEYGSPVVAQIDGSQELSLVQASFPEIANAVRQIRSTI